MFLRKVYNIIVESYYSYYDCYCYYCNYYLDISSLANIIFFSGRMHVCFYLYNMDKIFFTELRGQFNV